MAVGNDGACYIPKFHQIFRPDQVGLLGRYTYPRTPLLIDYPLSDGFKSDMLTGPAAYFDP